jgi:hypothetical protein
MAELTIAGGVRTGVASLTPSEHQAALNALSKLSSGAGATHGIASVLGRSLPSATLSGGTVHDVARTSESFIGGVRTGVATISSVGSDTVVAGSGITGKPESAGSAAAGTAHPLSLSGDTINVSGSTAAGVKHEALPAGKAVGQTITLSDKTTITLTGVSPHDVTKPH